MNRKNAENNENSKNKEFTNVDAHKDEESVLGLGQLANIMVDNVINDDNFDLDYINNLSFNSSIISGIENESYYDDISEFNQNSHNVNDFRRDSQRYKTTKTTKTTNSPDIYQKELNIHAKPFIHRSTKRSGTTIQEVPFKFGENPDKKQVSFQNVNYQYIGNSSIKGNPRRLDSNSTTATFSRCGGNSSKVYNGMGSGRGEYLYNNNINNINQSNSIFKSNSDYSNNRSNHNLIPNNDFVFISNPEVSAINHNFMINNLVQNHNIINNKIIYDIDNENTEQETHLQNVNFK